MCQNIEKSQQNITMIVDAKCWKGIPAESKQSNLYTPCRLCKTYINGVRFLQKRAYQ